MSTCESAMQQFQTVRRCSGLSVRLATRRLVCNSHVILKTLKAIFNTKRIVRRKSRQVRLWCPYIRHLRRFLHVYVANRRWGEAIYPSYWASLTKDFRTKDKLRRKGGGASSINFLDWAKYETRLSDFVFEVFTSYSVGYRSLLSEVMI